MQNSRNDAQRGGAATPISGTFPVYLFHINKSGSQKYVHVLVTNPNSSSITISGKGSMYTNSEKPLYGSGTGQSYHVSRDWLDNTPRYSFTNVTLQPYKAYEVAKLPVAQGAMVDGRFEVTASAGAYVYTVVTSGGVLQMLSINLRVVPQMGIFSLRDLMLMVEKLAFMKMVCGAGAQIFLYHPQLLIWDWH
ncbi:hypothetical protein [Mangrovivirga cuniculi]|uniref:hypothetical protein n=1 Tax=Mangrovivirga cuniculi TaxID=2715131 RepID=UPI001FE97859|nr:hypothetical protein [Mangrovivirga cuniculi]